MGGGIGAMHFIGMAAMQGISRQLIMHVRTQAVAGFRPDAVVLWGIALTIDFLIDRNKKGRGAIWAKIGAVGDHGMCYFWHALYRHGGYLFFCWRSYLRF